MKKFNDYIKEDLRLDGPEDNGNQDVIFADIESDIEQMPQDEVNVYLGSIIQFCEEKMTPMSDSDRLNWFGGR